MCFIFFNVLRVFSCNIMLRSFSSNVKLCYVVLCYDLLCLFISSCCVGLALCSDVLCCIVFLMFYYVVMHYFVFRSVVLWCFLLFFGMFFCFQCYNVLSYVSLCFFCGVMLCCLLWWFVELRSDFLYCVFLLWCVAYRVTFFSFKYVVFWFFFVI